MIHIPDGDVGSQNYWTKKALEDINGTALQIFDTDFVLRIVENLQHFAGAEIALQFAKKVIQYQIK